MSGADPWIEETARRLSGGSKSTDDWLIVCRHLAPLPGRDAGVRRFVELRACPGAAARILRQRAAEARAAEEAGS